MKKDCNTEAFFTLVRMGIGHHTGCPIRNVEWNVIESLAEEQGLSAIIIDGVEIIPEECRPPKLLLLQWIGEVLQNYEQRYELYRRTIAEMAGFYKQYGYKMMVLKGYGCSLDWPKPEHRPCGDIDIWLFGKQAEADNVLQKEKGIKIDKSEHHHTVFYWHDFMVENHYDIVNVHSHKSSKELEVLFKELGTDDSYSVELYGEKVYLPVPNFHALFLLRHAASHFVAEGINLRQILDWAFFVEKHTKEIDWPWIVSMLEKYHMKDFYNCINAICVGDSGFPVNIFSAVQFDPYLKDRVLADIIYPQFAHVLPINLFSRLIIKWRRWRNNNWKRKLCYNENTFSSLIYGINAHLLKPTSI